MVKMILRTKRLEVSKEIFEYVQNHVINSPNDLYNVIAFYILENYNRKRFKKR